MNRRAFMTVLGSGLVALSLPPLEWVPGVQAAALSALDLSTIDGVTAAMVREMAALMPDLRGTFIAGAHHIGAHGLNHQWNLAVSGEEDGSLALDTRIKPGAEALMANLRDKRTFGALPTLGLGDCDAAVATDERTGLCVRGIRRFALGDDFLPKGWNYRFDVVAG